MIDSALNLRASRRPCCCAVAEEAGADTGTGAGSGARPADECAAFGEGWLSAILSDFPDLRRSPASRHPLPADWAAAFSGPAAASFVVGISDQGLYSVPSAKDPSGPTGPVVRKRNFLEVLRPDAPVRVWDPELGEWVEKAETARG